MPPFPPPSEPRDVRVAVIDSGVNPRHPHIGPIAGGVTVTAEGAIDADGWIDRLGHGTAVMAAIQEKAPAALYFAVKVFHDRLRTTAHNLARAMEWAIDQQMDVINLSLGTRNPMHAELFRPLIDRAIEQGIAVVSARGCLPGMLPGVFAVGQDSECPRDEYRFDGEGFLASPYPRPAPHLPRERNLQGISFAVANFSGFVAQARAIMSFSELMMAMLRNAAASERSSRSKPRYP